MQIGSGPYPCLAKMIANPLGGGGPLLFIDLPSFPHPYPSNDRAPLVSPRSRGGFFEELTPVYEEHQGLREHPQEGAQRRSPLLTPPSDQARAGLRLAHRGDSSKNPL